MTYRSLRACVDDLEAHGHLVRIEERVDPRLEASEIHRRVFNARGPAIYYANVKGSPFPMVSNLFGTMERSRFIFRHTLERVRRLIELKVDPTAFWRKPTKYMGVPRAALGMLPKRVGGGPILDNQTQIDQLPQQVSWPDDGGAFITLPQVYTEDVRKPGLSNSNLGMYRIQLSGNEYERNREIGLHYQLHRGIGVHQTAAMERGEPFRVNIFVGGPPAMNLAAVMPLPEGLSELRFAGALAGRRVRMVKNGDGLPLHADADFCITGTVIPGKKLPEGPFGDHLGYYSLAHDFPVLAVDKVYHRNDAVWPFTVVGRPPQEDTMFGELIHELTGPIIPTIIPGVKAVHAVDAAGVHPLLLAIGSERYVPFEETTRPQELLTQANAILGQGQLSLAKYLWITADDKRSACDAGGRGGASSRPLDIEEIDEFFMHILRRVNWRRDVHFQTCTTIDTLDYSGSGLNEGSKVVIAAVGPPVRELPKDLPSGMTVPAPFSDPWVVMPGVMAIRGPAAEEVPSLDEFCAAYDEQGIGGFPLVVVVDDAEFTARRLKNFLWVTFTRSNPAADIYGTCAETRAKHWGCEGSLVIDARTKLHHAPPLIEDPTVTKWVDELARKGGPLCGII